MGKKLNFMIWMLCIAFLLLALSLGFGNIRPSIRLILIVLLIILVIFLSWRGEKKKAISERMERNAVLFYQILAPISVIIGYSVGAFFIIVLGGRFLSSNKVGDFFGCVIFGLILIIAAFLIHQRLRKNYKASKFRTI